MKKILIALLVLAVLAFGYWTISPLFIDKKVNDALPTQTVTEHSSEEGETSTPIEEPRTRTEGPFEIIGTSGHPASGSVNLIQTPEGMTVRYKNYDGTNGPDLYVYLTNDLEAEEFVDLGRAKGNQGNINYSVPEDVDIDEYQYVITWCKAFGVLFDYAEIN